MEYLGNQLVEYAMEFESHEDFELVEKVLAKMGIAYTFGHPRFTTLEEYECDFDGK